MNSSLLEAAASFPMLQQGFTINLNWLGKFVGLIVEGVGIVGVGVIVFTLILKLITTPFDIYQRFSMRKQTLVMRSMQSDLQKLQKQYANDQRTYNMKVRELQQKSGVNLLGACLPFLISFIILIVAVTAFQSYANYANLSMYRGMAESYNEAVKAYSVETQDESTIQTIPFSDGSIQKIKVASTAPGCYLYYTYEAGAEENSNLRKEYYIDLDKFYFSQQDPALKQELVSLVEEYRSECLENGIEESEEDAAVVVCVKWFEKLGSQAAAKEFRESKNPGFLWIKNVWYPDVSYRHPIQDYTAFTNSINAKIIDDYGNQVKITDIFSPAEYENLTQDLVAEKTQANGYYILILLTIALMILSQIITMKSSKESMQYQSVDGSSAKKQQIIMTVFMVAIYAVTGFVWTAAFSIYIAVSTIFGILITLICNLVMGRIFRRKEEEEIKAKYHRSIPGRDASVKKGREKQK